MRKARTGAREGHKESRLLLVLLVVIAFALITVDIRGGENSPLDRPRQAAQSVFGPVEKAVSGAVDPVGNAIDAVRNSGHRSSTITRLERENEALKQQLGSKDITRNRAAELDKLLKTAGAGQYTHQGRAGHRDRSGPGLLLDGHHRRRQQGRHRPAT